MKKVVVLTVLAVLGLTNVNAQKINFGIKGGLNIAQVKGLDAQGSDRITDYNFGFQVEMPISEKFSFQPELLYTTKGFSVNEGINVNLGGFPIPAGVTANTKINYLEMPLLAKYKFGSEGLRFNITAGPVVSYAANAQLVTRANLLLDINPLKTNIELDALNYERLEISASIGAGMAYETSGG